VSVIYTYCTELKCTLKHYNIIKLAAVYFSMLGNTAWIVNHSVCIVITPICIKKRYTLTNGITDKMEVNIQKMSIFLLREYLKTI